MHEFRQEPDAELVRVVREKLAGLRDRVPGVDSCVVAGVDGLLVLHDSAESPEPHDLAAIAAAMFGLGRQTSMTLRHGGFRESTIHSDNGYFAVYAVGQYALLAVVGSGTLNIARLHLEARATSATLTDLLEIGTGDQPESLDRQDLPDSSVAGDQTVTEAPTQRPASVRPARVP